MADAVDSTNPFTNPRHEPKTLCKSPGSNLDNTRERQDSGFRASESPKSLPVDDRFLPPVPNLRRDDAAYRPNETSQDSLNASALPSIVPPGLVGSRPLLSEMPVGKLAGGRTASSPIIPARPESAERSTTSRKASADGAMLPSRRPPPVPLVHSNNVAGSKCGHIQHLSQSQKELVDVLKELCSKIDDMDKRLDGITIRTWFDWQTLPRQRKSGHGDDAFNAPFTTTNLGEERDDGWLGSRVRRTMRSNSSRPAFS